MKNYKIPSVWSLKGNKISRAVSHAWAKCYSNTNNEYPLFIVILTMSYMGDKYHEGVNPLSFIGLMKYLKLLK